MLSIWIQTPRAGRYPSQRKRKRPYLTQYLCYIRLWYIKRCPSALGIFWYVKDLCSLNIEQATAVSVKGAARPTAFVLIQPRKLDHFFQTLSVHFTATLLGWEGNKQSIVSPNRSIVIGHIGHSYWTRATELYLHHPILNEEFES